MYAAQLQPEGDQDVLQSLLQTRAVSASDLELVLSTGTSEAFQYCLTVVFVHVGVTMHYEQNKRGFAPIRDFNLKSGMRAFRFIDHRASNPEPSNLSPRQQNSLFAQLRLS